MEWRTSKLGGCFPRVNLLSMAAILIELSKLSKDPRDFQKDWHEPNAESSEEYVHRHMVINFMKSDHLFAFTRHVEDILSSDPLASRSIVVDGDSVLLNTVPSKKWTRRKWTSMFNDPGLRAHAPKFQDVSRGSKSIMDVKGTHGCPTEIGFAS